MSYRDDYRAVEREGIWTLPRIVLAGFVLLVLLYGVGFLMTGGDLFIYQFWAPKQANAENKVFHNTQAYTDGKNVHIGSLCIESVKADGNVKAAFDAEIRTEASTVDFSQLSPDNQACVLRAKGN
jgi:hypothetical protein